jgi:23S rRNA (pseudouridine1915-N3)-methyltransferase
MFHCTMMTVGKLKESHWREAQAEYLRRLGPFMKIEVIEVEAEPFGGTVTAAQAMKTEGERILKRLPDDAFVVALERTGKEMSSVAFSELLTSEGDAGAHVVFVIGGAAGLDATVLARARRKISLSEMTFTHEMARVIMLEQLYRAMTIIAGKAYHY